MSALERRAGWPPLLPDVFDWLETGIPGVPVWRAAPGTHGIRIEERMTDEAYVVTAELPGIDPEKDVEISVGDGVLTLRAERTQETEHRHHTEFHYGSFARSVRLPAGARAEDATAGYKDGLLTVMVPLAAKKAEAKTVKVRRIP
jgi:HSP20 family molecular chaperone IbpA